MLLGRPRGNAGRVQIFSDEEEGGDTRAVQLWDNDGATGARFDDDIEYDDDACWSDGNRRDFQDDEDFDQEDDQPGRVPSSPCSSSPNPNQRASPRDDVDDEYPEQGEPDADDNEGSGNEGGSTNGTMIPCPKPIGTPSKRGPRAKDYDVDVKHVLKVANSLFRCRVSTVNAFPSDVLEEEWAQICWGEACKALDVSYAADLKVIKILRGELKSKVRPLVESLYGFNDSSAKKAIRENRDRAVALISESAFVYEDPAVNQPDSAYTERKGIYRHPIIQKAINITWFMNRSDEGILYNRFFGPAIPIETIALVLTAVQCCIDEWGTGKRTGVSFWENDYKPIYLSHKENLEAFDELNDNAHRHLLKLRKKLHTEARFHSGAEDIDRSAGTLSRDALSHALQQAMEADEDGDVDDT
ncbi:hypothetical protein EVJ58_g7483 [Rhodofomes roseus]|uniref:DUF6532 domain-containing protein n=1 Tax=Rhodofomes roseus TaxID=34475 RepID=A0A4Y9Y3B9_9APHY|nr:hypothetical protein EVJ58_g7483 [Rhodofomes roseus]